MRKLLQRVLALILAMGILASGMPPEAVYAQDGEEEPVLTIACLSDLHNQMSLIDCALDDVRLRGSVTRTLEAIKNEEEIDMMILCGDYTSDSSNISEENWLKIRRLMVEATRDAFPESQEDKYVLWVDGNHDYEITREYNAGDYYTFPMKDDVGELPEEDRYDEWTYDQKYELLAAYYYELYGFDFLCLNTGNFIYDNPNGAGRYTQYRYSVESVEWIRQKLEKIYEGDPNKEKTVFFVTHIPFDDSNSINKGKGMDENDEATILLKKTLAEYPNLIHLYGHDHGGNAAFIRTATEQRVTQYDMDGNKLSNEKHSPIWQVERVSGGYTIRSMADGKYLGYADSNLTLTDTPALCQIEKTIGGYEITTGNNERPYVYFSTSSKTFSANKESCAIELLLQTEAEDGRYSFTSVDGEVESGQYAFAKTQEGSIYMMTDETNGMEGTDLRMLPVTADLDEQGNTFYKETQQKDASFLTSFVGSMRYYSNDINYPSSASDSDVVQALMIYVYNDRVELRMKNYGTYEYYDQPYPASPSIFIAKNPVPYYIYRKVQNNYAYTADLKALVEELDVLPLTGYTADSVRMFAAQLNAAKRLLNQSPEQISQSMVDYFIQRLNAVRKGLTVAKAPEQPAGPQQPSAEQPDPQPQPTVQVPQLSKFSLKAAVKKNGKVSLSWKKQGKADGYVIQMKKKKGKFKQLAKISRKSTVKKTTKKLAKGSYQFRIRSYAVYQNAAGTKQTAYSPYSKTVKVTIKK